MKKIVCHCVSWSPKSMEMNRLSYVLQLNCTNVMYLLTLNLVWISTQFESTATRYISNSTHRNASCNACHFMWAASSLELIR